MVYDLCHFWIFLVFTDPPMLQLSSLHLHPSFSPSVTSICPSTFRSQVSHHPPPHSPFKASCFCLSWAHFWFPDFYQHLNPQMAEEIHCSCSWTRVTSLARIICSSTHLPEISVISYSFLVVFDRFMTTSSLTTLRFLGWHGEHCLKWEVVCWSYHSL